MGRVRAVWTAPDKFWLPNGAAAEGRPDIRQLMAAREAFESTGTTENSSIREQGAEKRALREQAADGQATLKALLGDDMPSGLLSSSHFGKLKAMTTGARMEESAGPSDRPSSSQGAHEERRHRDRILGLKQPALHASLQRPATPGAGDPPGGSTAFQPASPTRAFVRVGVPVDTILAQPMPGGQQAAIFGGSTRPPTSGSFRAGLAGSLPRLPTGQVGGALPPTSLHHTSMISLGNATADLPMGAVKTVRKLLHEGRAVTVAGIHQRRPPYYDMGPVGEVDVGPPSGGGPQDHFGRSLRGGGDFQPHARKMPAFKLGCPPPWHGLKQNAEWDTFDFSAKLDGVKYYTQDFTEPSKAPLRPPTAGTTRYAANVPSMMLKRSAGAPLVMPLVDVVLAGMDSGYRMRHADEGVPFKRPPTAPGRHLLPYANDPTRQAAHALFLP